MTQGRERQPRLLLSAPVATLAPGSLPGQLVSERHITEPSPLLPHFLPPPHGTRTALSCGRRSAATARPAEPLLRPLQFRKVPPSVLWLLLFLSGRPSAEERLSRHRCHPGQPKPVPAGLWGSSAGAGPPAAPVSTISCCLRSFHDTALQSRRRLTHQPLKNPLKSIFCRLIKSRLLLLGGEQPAEADLMSTKNVWSSGLVLQR